MANPRKTIRLTSVKRLCELAEEGRRGRTWYTKAAGEIRQAADILDIDAARFADFLAIFSPRVSVVRNIRLTTWYITHGIPHRTTMLSVRLALDHYLATGRIRGIKTSPFAAALQGKTSAVVLDVWMAKAFGIRQSLLERKAVHAECCRRVRLAAKRLGWTAAATQAAIWTATVRKAGRKPRPFVIIEHTLFGPKLEIAA